MFLTTPPTPLVRKARLQDLDALLHLEHSSFTTDLLSRARMRHWIKATNGILLVAINPEKPNVPLGYCLACLRKNSTTVRLYSLATAATARGLGIGALLLRNVESHALKAGCTRARLEVAEHNANAIRLYQKMDYQQFDYLPGFYEDGQNALRLQKNLKKQS
jgi:ribosomal protein S18 acetylase RimI-like enzyme